jgi:hypothetical protein
VPRVEPTVRAVALLSLLVCGCPSAKGPVESGSGNGDAGASADASLPGAAPDGGATAGLIGPAGGTVSVEGATLVIPPGALATPTAITIVKDPRQVTTRFVVASPIFIFGPVGLRFDKPALVQLATWSSGDESVYWAGPDEGSFDELATTRTGTIVTATVLELRRGFVAIPRCQQSKLLTWCKRECVPLDVDLQNCGRCGHACAKDGTCSGGRCSLEGDSGNPAPDPTRDSCTSFQVQARVFTSAATVSVTAPDCTIVRGTLSVPALPDKAVGWGAHVTLVGVQGELYHPQVTPLSATSAAYEGAVPPGLYQGTFALGQSFYADGLQENIFSTSRQPVEVRAGQFNVHDVMAPPVPTLGRYRGTLTGLDTLPRSSDTATFDVQFVLESADGTFSAVAWWKSMLANQFESMLLWAPAGPLHVVMNVSDRASAGGKVGPWRSTIDLGMVMMQEDFHLAVPALATLSGSLVEGAAHLWSSADAPVPSEVQVAPPSSPLPEPPSWLYPAGGHGGVAADRLQYLVVVNKDVSRTLRTALQIPLGPPGRLASGYRRENGAGTLISAPLEQVTFAGNLVRNFEVPTFADPITVTGTVRDERRQVAHNYLVVARSMDSGGSVLEAKVLSDAWGSFVLHLLPGTYDLTLSRAGGCDDYAVCCRVGPLPSLVSTADPSCQQIAFHRDEMVCESAIASAQQSHACLSPESH